RNQSALGHRIGEAVGDAERSGDRCHIQNNATALLLHRRNDVLHHVVSALHVDLKEAVEILLRSRLECADMRNPRIIDQDVNVPCLIKNRLDGFAGLSMVGNVARHHRSLSSSRADSVGGFTAAGLIQFDDKHVCTMLSETKGHSLADAATSAGDNNSLTCIIEKCRHDLQWWPINIQY